jgi:hypothetical protein
MEGLEAEAFLADKAYDTKEGQLLLESIGKREKTLCCL